MTYFRWFAHKVFLYTESAKGSVTHYRRDFATAQSHKLRPTEINCYSRTWSTALTRCGFTAEYYGRNKSYKNCSRKFVSRLSRVQIPPKSTLHGQVNKFRKGYPRRSNRKHGLFFENKLLTTNHEVPGSIPGSTMCVFPWKGKTPMVTMVWVVGRN